MEINLIHHKAEEPPHGSLITFIYYEKTSGITVIFRTGVYELSHEYMDYEAQELYPEVSKHEPKGGGILSLKGDLLRLSESYPAPIKEDVLDKIRRNLKEVNVLV